MRTAKQTPVPISWTIKGGDSKIPSLTMLINPENLDTSYSALINETRTLGGFVHEYWGEQLTSLSASGKTAMFVDTDKGITNKDNRSTESYKYFISLLNIYKNNGKEYQENITSKTPIALRYNTSKLTNLGYIQMIFDKKQYDGYFESFSYTEDAAMPFNLEYSFTFKVMRIIGAKYVY